jgi:large subunit ribosomal protein L25
VPTKIPEVVEVDISGLAEVDAAVRLSDLRLPEGVSVVGDPDEVIVKLTARRVAAEVAEAPTEEAAGAAEAEAAQES